MGEVRDRIRSLRRVKASTLMANPKNFRRHPDSQRNRLRAILSEVGYADALLAREETDGSLVLIDGHLRAEITPDQRVPVLVLDVSEAEADKLLATLDSVSQMAEVDKSKLSDLLRQIEFEEADLKRLADQIAPKVIDEEQAPGEEEDGGTETDGMNLAPHEHYDYVVICARDSSTWNTLCAALGIGVERIKGLKKSRLGICRAVAAERVLDVLQAHNSKPKKATSD